MVTRNLAVLKPAKGQGSGDIEQQINDISTLFALYQQSADFRRHYESIPFLYSYLTRNERRCRCATTAAYVHLNPHHGP